MLTRGYNQDATYWGTPISNGMGGYTFASPQGLKVRWEEKRMEYANDKGDILVSNAVVYVPMDVEVGGYLFLGTSTENDPTKIDKAFEIKQVMKIPDLRNARAERRAFL